MHVELAVIQRGRLCHIRGVLVPGLDGGLEQGGVLRDRIGPEHAFDIDNEAVHAQFLDGIREIVLFESGGDARVASGLIVGLDSAEEDSPRPGHRTCLGAKTAFGTVGGGDTLLLGATGLLLGCPLLCARIGGYLGVEILKLLALTLALLGVLSALTTLALLGILPAGTALSARATLAEAATLAATAAASLLLGRRIRRRAFLERERVVQDIVDILLPYIEEFLVIQQETQTGQTVEVVGGLLETPPVGAAGLGVTLKLAGPEDGVVRISHGLRMTGQTVALTLQDFLEPALRLDLVDHAFGESSIRGCRDIGAGYDRQFWGEEVEDIGTAGRNVQFVGEVVHLAGNDILAGGIAAHDVAVTAH